MYIYWPGEVQWNIPYPNIYNKYFEIIRENIDQGHPLTLAQKDDLLHNRYVVAEPFQHLDTYPDDIEECYED